MKISGSAQRPRKTSEDWRYWRFGVVAASQDEARPVTINSFVSPRKGLVFCMCKADATNTIKPDPTFQHGKRAVLVWREFGRLERILTVVVAEIVRHLSTNFWLESSSPSNRITLYSTQGSKEELTARYDSARRTLLRANGAVRRFEPTWIWGFIHQPCSAGRQVRTAGNPTQEHPGTVKSTSSKPPDHRAYRILAAEWPTAGADEKSHETQRLRLPIQRAMVHPLSCPNWPRP
ncbi:hypothetical protein B0I37DRAFT_36004 [Chaetomium sp. MPI-CAGE-AT-0009]|nr:hypothetical protein B0I37DRAFT_36004 [Chaetomium sp. MPI-CAGE-AT-0009]